MAATWPDDLVSVGEGGCRGVIDRNGAKRQLQALDGGSGGDRLCRHDDLARGEGCLRLLLPLAAEHERGSAGRKGQQHTDHQHQRPSPAVVLELHLHGGRLLLRGSRATGRSAPGRDGPVRASASIRAWVSACHGPIGSGSVGLFSTPHPSAPRQTTADRTFLPAPGVRPPMNACSVWGLRRYHAGMADFQLVAPFKPTGDQPQAIEQLVAGIRDGRKHQVLLGATGTGKTLHGLGGHRAASTSPRSCWRTTRRWRPSSTASSAISSRTTPWSTSSATSTTTSRRPTCPAATPTSRRTPPGTRRSTSCATPPRGPCSSGATSSSWPASRASTASARPWTTAPRSCACASGGRYRRDGVLRQLVDLQYAAQRPGPQPGEVPRPRRHPGAAARL